MTDDEMTTLERTLLEADAAESRAENDGIQLAYWMRAEAAATARAEKAEALGSFKAATAAVNALTDRARDAEARESELGLQVVAQAARLRLADAVVAPARVLVEALDESDDVGACDFGSSRVPLDKALAAWDAVPGDQG